MGARHPRAHLAGLGAGLGIDELAGVAATYVFLVELFVHRDVGLREVPRLLGQAMALTGAVVVIMATATSLTNCIVDEQLPTKLFEAESAYGVTETWHFIIVLNVFLYVVARLYRVWVPFLGVLLVGLVVIMIWPSLSTIAVQPASTPRTQPRFAPVRLHAKPAVSTASRRTATTRRTAVGTAEGRFGPTRARTQTWRISSTIHERSRTPPPTAVKARACAPAPMPLSDRACVVGR